MNYSSRLHTPQEFAPGVYHLALGRGPLRVNVYFVRTDIAPGPKQSDTPARGETASPASTPQLATGSWLLIDTGTPGCAAEIRAAAERLFGPGAAPTAILVTHAHPDHVGSAAGLARAWDRPVYLHAEEVRMIGGEMGHFWKHSFKLDRWLILPLLRLGGKRHIRAIMARNGLRDFAHELRGRQVDQAVAETASGALPSSHAPGTELAMPGLPGWRVIHTPGHTPGHVALFRPHDRVLISGDAVTTRVEPFSALFGKRASISGPPWYFTWDRKLARLSIAALAALEPRVIAGGHGLPYQSARLPDDLQRLAEDY